MQAPLTAFSRSRAKSPASLTIMGAVLWAAALIGLGASSMKTGVFDAMSTDDAMRLVEVRDLIAGQGWFDLVQHRLDPPGLAMHWSRLIDAPLAALMLILRPVAGARGSEAVTLVLWPALLFGAALLLVSAIAKRMCDDANRRHAQLVAVLLAVLSAPALIHFRTGAIDHHNAQIVLLLAFVLLTSEISQDALTAFLAGLAAMLSLAIGLEMLPAIAVACVAVFALLIWQGGALSRPATIFGASLAGSSCLLVAALLPIHSLQNPVCDAFGGPLVLLTAGGGVSLIMIAAVNRHQPTWRARLITGVIAGGALIGLFFKLFPGCMASPYAQIDPLLRTFWLDSVLEAMSFQSVLQLEPEKIPGLYGFPLITLGLTIAALMRRAPHTRFRFIAPVLVLAALIGISFWAMRGAAAANIVAAPLFAASAASIWPSREQARRWVLAGLIISPVGLTGLGFAVRLSIDWIKPQSGVVLVETPAPCQTVSGASSLSVFPSGRVMAPIDFGPAVLAATGHSVFAAPYHRNNDGNLAMVNAMLATPKAAQKMLADHQVDYVVICAGSPDQLDFVKLSPDGLAAGLGRGEVPDFLEPLDLGANHTIAAWHVRK